MKATANISNTSPTRNAPTKTVRLGGRRLARAVAAQVLYQIDMTGDGADAVRQLQPWAAEFKVSPRNLVFAEALVAGVLAQQAELDAVLAAQAQEWTLARMSAVDRNLLRLALFEMRCWPETPQRVAVNEAVELAKRFGGDDSGRFINGILHKLLDEAEKEV
jgi:N utilization substance protein B